MGGDILRAVREEVGGFVDIVIGEFRIEAHHHDIGVLLRQRDARRLKVAPQVVVAQQIDRFALSVAL